MLKTIFYNGRVWRINKTINDPIYGILLEVCLDNGDPEPFLVTISLNALEK